MQTLDYFMTSIGSLLKRGENDFNPSPVDEGFTLPEKDLLSIGLNN